MNERERLHRKMFPEEYDFENDSYSDSNMRKLGKNPMSQGYIEERNRIRAEMGVEPWDLKPINKPGFISSWEWVDNKLSENS